MNPGERIKLITESAELLAKREYPEMDLILEQFGMSTSDTWAGDPKSYAIAMMRHNHDNAALQELHQFLTGHSDLAGVTSGPHPWKKSGLRLFMSHLAKHQGEVGRTAGRLENDGIDAFVAHTSIDPSLQWQDVIESALRSCDASTSVRPLAISASTNTENSATVGGCAFLISVCSRSHWTLSRKDASQTILSGISLACASEYFCVDIGSSNRNGESSVSYTAGPVAGRLLIYVGQHG
jgi:hypothetical protein